MKVSLNWLKDYVTINIAPEKLAHKLTMAGFEVEKMTTVEDDVVFELEITPNRPDCLNMLGMAREIAAILNVPRKTPRLKALKASFPSCDIKILDKKGCSRYHGTLIRNVRVGETPAWIQQRLNALGIRSVNNVVDITNFVLMETGQPLHAFDYDKLSGGKVVVRRAQDGEILTAIDGNGYALDSSVLVIADAHRPAAIAGIMGGKDTEVTTETKNILLESACFDPILIRRASRKLGIAGDSSYRFERGIDYQTVKTAAGRATGLILESAGGVIAGRTDKEVSRKVSRPPAIVLAPEEINSFLGTALTAARCTKILRQLGFAPARGKAHTLKVTPPAFRPDVREAVDVIEEIARVVGYDALPVSLPSVAATSVVPPASAEFRQAIRVALLSQGLDEVLTYTMISEKDLRQSRQEDLRGVKIQNPLSRDQGLLRPSLLPSLLATAAFNLNRGQKNLKIFEIGKIYPDAGTPPSSDEGGKAFRSGFRSAESRGEGCRGLKSAGLHGQTGEEETLGILLTGRGTHDWRRPEKLETDFYDLKGVITETAARLCRREMVLDPAAQPFLAKGQGVGLIVEGVEIGVLGKVEGQVLDKWDIRQKNVFFAQLSLAKLLPFYLPHRPYRRIPGYPAVVRDVSLAVKASVPFGQVGALAFRLGAGILDSLTFNEEYRGEKIPAGHRGLVFSLRYRAADRTLREEEVNGVHDRILRALAAELGAIQR